MIIYVSKGDKKGAIIERFNRTLKSRLEMFFTDTEKHIWIDVLDNFIANYNDTLHRSIGMAPSSVTIENQEKVYKRLYPDAKQSKPCYFEVNDRVRIIRKKNLFDKGYVKSMMNHIIQTI